MLCVSLGSYRTEKGAKLFIYCVKTQIKKQELFELLKDAVIAKYSFSAVPRYLSYCLHKAKKAKRKNLKIEFIKNIAISKNIKKAFEIISPKSDRITIISFKSIEANLIKKIGEQIGPSRSQKELIKLFAVPKKALKNYKLEAFLEAKLAAEKIV